MKQMQEIYEEMLQTVEEKCGLAMDDSCDLAVRLYAAAAQLESLYAYADWSRRQSFPQTASGEYLDRHAALWGLTRQAGTCARGTLKLSMPQALQTAVTIPAGTEFAGENGLRYALEAACTVAAGQTAGTAPAVCQTAGTAGNAPAGSVTVLLEAPVYITAVTNPAAFTGGTEPEDDDTLRTRLMARVGATPNGANCAYYEAIALSCPGIVTAKAIGNYGGVGTVGLCVSARGASPSTDQINAVRSALSGRTELGITVGVFAPTRQKIDVTVSVEPVDGVTGEEAVAAARQAVADYFLSRKIGEGFLRAQAGSWIYQTGKVKNYVFALPVGDYDGSATTVAVPGTVTITEAQ